MSVGLLDLTHSRDQGRNASRRVDASASSGRSRKDDYHDSECAWALAFGVCMDNVRAARGTLDWVRKSAHACTCRDGMHHIIGISISTTNKLLLVVYSR